MMKNTRRGPVAIDRLTETERALLGERTNAMKNTGAAAESGEGSPERRDEGTARQLDYHDDAERTTPTFSPARTNGDADAQGTPSTIDTTMDTSSASPSSVTPGSKASVDFSNRFVFPSTADVKEMSPRARARRRRRGRRRMPRMRVRAPSSSSTSPTTSSCEAVSI